MATTYSTDKAASTASARGGVSGAQLVGVSYSLTSALATGDIIQLFKVQPGTVVHGLSVYSGGTQSGIDSVAVVGDQNDQDRFITSALGTMLRSGHGITSPISNICYQYTTADTIDLTVASAGTGQTDASATIKASLLFSMQDDV